MLSKIAIITCSIVSAAALITTGCSSEITTKGKFTDEQMQHIQQPITVGLPEPTGGFTISVGSELLTADKIVEQRLEEFAQSAKSAKSFDQFRQTAAPTMHSIVTNNIADLLLYQQAQKAIPENVDDEFMAKIVDEEVNRFIANYGGNYSEAEKAVHELGLDWKGFRDYQKRLIIVQSYIAGRTKQDRPIKYDDIVDYYDSIKQRRFATKPEIQFRLIDIQIDKFVQPDPNSQQGPTELAMDKANKIIEEFNAGQPFAGLAKTHSHGFTANQGGLWKPVSPGSLASPYDILETAAAEMNAGDISKPLKTDNHIFIMQLVKKTQANVIPFEKVQNRLEQELKFMQRRNAVDRLMTKIVKQVDANEINSFADFCLLQIYGRCTN